MEENEITIKYNIKNKTKINLFGTNLLKIIKISAKLRLKKIKK